MTLLYFLAVLAVLILVHELGHFLTARAFGIQVLEFGIGFPPRLASVTRGGTVYSINLLPLGGFVRLLGEEDPSHPRSLAGKPIPIRFTVITAGALMNLLLTVLLFALLFAVPQRVSQGLVVIREVAPGSPAERAGLRPGDIILEVDGQPVGLPQEVAYRTRLRLGAPTEWRVLRPRQPLGEGATGLPPGEERTVTLVPRWKPPPDQGAVGVALALVGAREVVRSYPPWEAVPRALRRTGEILVLLRNEVTRWVIGASAPRLAGPVGIAQMTGQVARAGWPALADFTALLSLNLAVLNLLPIPMLDGGRLLFLGLEFVRRGKRISPQREGLVHLVGFILLMMLVAIITYFDIQRIIQGESLLR